MEFENLIRLIEAVSRSELTGLKYEEGGVKLHLTKKQGQTKAAPVTEMAETAPAKTSEAQTAAPAPAPGGKIVESPLVELFTRPRRRTQSPLCLWGIK